MRHTLQGFAAAAALLAISACATAGSAPEPGGSRTASSGSVRPPCTPRWTPLADTTPLPPTIDVSDRPVTIAIVPDSVTVGGCRFGRNLYQVADRAPAYIPPTLRIRPGAALDLTVVNRMDAGLDTIYHGTTTNFHFHGFSVSPGLVPGAANRGDQVVSVSYDAGQRHAYGFRIPADHPVGMNWYHPHPHGLSDEQVGGGMSGAFLIGDLRPARLPREPNIPEKVVLVKDFQPDGANAFGGSVLTMNGQWPARFTIPTGTRQLWHLGNVGSDDLMGIRLVNRADPTDVLPLLVIAIDGNSLLRPVTVGALPLDPATRYAVIVQAPNRQGVVYRIVNTGKSSAVNGAAGDSLGTLTTVGPPLPTPMPPVYVAPDTSAARRAAELMARTGVTARRFAFRTTDNNTGREGFLINDSAYVHRRIDVMVPLGSTEDWTLVNEDTPGSTFASPHIFHIHQGDFLVTRMNGAAVSPTGFQDRLTIGEGDSLVIRMPFTEPLQTGLYVFHCHILFHEDNGMMMNLCIYPRGLGPDEARAFCQSQLPPAHAH
jgi:suppressor of ftsI